MTLGRDSYLLTTIEPYQFFFVNSVGGEWHLVLICIILITSEMNISFHTFSCSMFRRESFVFRRAVTSSAVTAPCPEHEGKHLLVVGVFPPGTSLPAGAWRAGVLDTLCVMLWMAPWSPAHLLEGCQLKQKVPCAVFDVSKERLSFPQRVGHWVCVSGVIFL